MKYARKIVYRTQDDVRDLKFRYIDINTGLEVSEDEYDDYRVLSEGDFLRVLNDLTPPEEEEETPEETPSRFSNFYRGYQEKDDDDREYSTDGTFKTDQTPHSRMSGENQEFDIGKATGDPLLEGITFNPISGSIAFGSNRSRENGYGYIGDTMGERIAAGLAKVGVAVSTGLGGGLIASGALNANNLAAFNAAAREKGVEPMPMASVEGLAAIVRGVPYAANKYRNLGRDTLYDMVAREAVTPNVAGVNPEVELDGQASMNTLEDDQAWNQHMADAAAAQNSAFGNQPNPTGRSVVTPTTPNNTQFAGNPSTLYDAEKHVVMGGFNNFTAPDSLVPSSGNAEINGYPSAIDLANYVAQAARDRGIDSNVALAIAEAEGLNSNLPGKQSTVARSGHGSRNGREDSWGVFQMYMGGGLGNQFQQATGLHPGDPQAAFMQIDYALDHAAENGWGAWYGAKNSGIANNQGLANAQAIGLRAQPGINPVAAGQVTMDAVRDAANAQAYASDFNRHLGFDGANMVNTPEMEQIKRGAEARYEEVKESLAYSPYDINSIDPEFADVADTALNPNRISDQVPAGFQEPTFAGDADENAGIGNRTVADYAVSGRPEEATPTQNMDGFATNTPVNPFTNYDQYGNRSVPGTGRGFGSDEFAQAPYEGGQGATAVPSRGTADPRSSMAESQYNQGFIRNEGEISPNTLRSMDRYQVDVGGSVLDPRVSIDDPDAQYQAMSMGIGLRPEYDMNANNYRPAEGFNFKANVAPSKNVSAYVEDRIGELIDRLASPEEVYQAVADLVTGGVTDPAEANAIMSQKLQDFVGGPTQPAGFQQWGSPTFPQMSTFNPNVNNRELTNNYARLTGQPFNPTAQLGFNVGLDQPLMRTDPNGIVNLMSDTRFLADPTQYKEGQPGVFHPNTFNPYQSTHKNYTATPKILSGALSPFSQVASPLAGVVAQAINSDMTVGELAQSINVAIAERNEGPQFQAESFLGSGFSSTSPIGGDSDGGFGFSGLSSSYDGPSYSDGPTIGGYDGPGYGSSFGSGGDSSYDSGGSSPSIGGYDGPGYGSGFGGGGDSSSDPGAPSSGGSGGGYTGGGPTSGPSTGGSSGGGGYTGGGPTSGPSTSPDIGGYDGPGYGGF